MNLKNNLFDSRKAFQEAGAKELLIPINEDLKVQLQRTVLDIYIDIQDYCKRNNIIPFLVGGSALGAIRHQGFIPWDDDLDIGMIRSQYERFVVGFRKEYSNKYIVNSAGKDNNAKVRFTKVMKIGTLFQEIYSPDDDSINGIFVDVFPIDNVPNNRVLRFFKGMHCNFLEFISSQVFYNENKNDEIIMLLKKTGKANYYIRKLVGVLFSFRKSSKWFARLDKCEQWNDEKSLCCSIVPGRKHYFGEIISRSIIFPERYVEFSGIKAPVFNNVELYLSNMYGDFMVIPPEDKREIHMVRKLKF